MLITVLTVSVALGFLLLQWIPHQLADPEAKQLNKPAERLTHLNTVRGMVLQTAAGLAVLGGLVYTGRGYILSRQSQVTDRYAGAVSQLSSDNLDARLGGVFALQRLARDSRHDIASIAQVLSSFVVRRCPVTEPAPGGQVWDSERPSQTSQPPRSEPDVHAALTVLGSLGRRTRVELSESDLRGAELDGLSFEGGEVSRSLLRGADLRRSVLREAELDDTDLRGARLEHADLTAARLRRADLRGAEMKGAAFDDCLLSSARLEDTWASSVSFRGADLFSARLDGARLDGADLRNATLINVSLGRADLTGADLSGADLYGADLSGTILVAADLRLARSLTPEQLLSAVLGQRTRLPAGLAHLRDDLGTTNGAGNGIVIT
ncbi:pentapeptide repeat-containing protein (plasmid) [Streptomyces scopuliridis]|uniref:pentapeptide repeat-containing protein n=1 Tax=Streptomyces scopuliridis TaxID=452529 RepID=UPI002DDB750F|nr:pentapeptide repeat-containing protein [Streptomyces scopuliridis]WSB39149.1 pentapeptide repeat-containing protein [Streptomyces scopuliridis]